MPWYYAESGKQVGPVEEAPFQSLVDSGAIRDETLVWCPGMANWQPYRLLRPQPLPAGADGEHFCSECGKPFPASDLVVFGNSAVCASCKPLFTQKMLEGARLPGTPEYGGFWIRFAASVIDGVVLYLVGILLLGVAMMFVHVDWQNLGRTLSPADLLQLLALEGSLLGVNLIIAATYETWFVGRFAATPGKMVCGLRVVLSDGGKVTYLRSLARHFAKFLSSLTLAVGYIMAGIDDEKRALHDRICETRVVKK